MDGTIYLLHFDRPLGHARHYMGWSGDVAARLERHRKGNGSRLMRAVEKAGIGWKLARTWPGDRNRERQLKRQGGHGRKCPICKGDGQRP